MSEGRKEWSEDKTYERIGEFVVSFQWLEGRLREIGWLILDPDRADYPPQALRKERNEELIRSVEELFMSALPKCRLPEDLETSFRDTFKDVAKRLHAIRRHRNKVLHSAYIELKGGGDVVRIMRSNPKLQKDPETGEPMFDQEFLSADSFQDEMKEMAEVAFALNHCYMQLIARFPQSNGMEKS